MKVKAIETIYKGYRFRSRLEAKWAVFFDDIGIEWIYEPEGFVFSDGTKYLPDFYLPESKEFFEVKGIMTEEDDHKVQKLIEELQIGITVGFSDFTFIACCNPWPKSTISQESKDNSCLVRCEKCGKHYFSGTSESYACKVCGAWDGDHYFSPILYGDGSVTGYDFGRKAAYALLQAKQARFEHGETPGGD